MHRVRGGVHDLNVWPAFTDAMLAFVLVLVLMMVFQVGHGIHVVDGPSGPETFERDMEQVENLIEEIRMTHPDVHLKRDAARHDITFGSDALFATASADLAIRGRAILAELAHTITEKGISTLEEIQISGHTDDVPTAVSRFPTNWELSTARATNVVRFLTDQGIDPTQIHLSATGYGEFRPDTSNATVAGRAKNRRIEMRLLYSASRGRAAASEG